MSKVYQVITDRIVAQLEAGAIPWRKPWSGERFHPCNAVSKRPYRGINTFLLGCCNDHASPFWLTFKQAKELGGTVKKGEKSMPVVFWKWQEREDKDTGKKKDVPIVRYYNVFNVSQCDLPQDKLPELPAEKTYDFTPIEACDRVVHEMAKCPTLRNDSHSAYYRPSEDTVFMPPAVRFEKPEEYYSTLFHELTHATGHASRLDRASITELAAFGTPTYSKEELIAEMGAAFLCGHCGIEQATLENSTAYIKGWLTKLKGDSRLVIHAAAAAQNAADFVLGKSHDKDHAE